MTRTVRRTTGLVAAGALAVGLVVTTAPARAVDQASAGSNSRWLASELVDGRYANPFSGKTDYGLMLDGLFAMHASGNAALSKPIVDAITADGAMQYISYAGFLGPDGLQDRMGGQTAKTLLAAQVAGADPTAFGGVDVLAETENVIVKATDFQPGGRFAAGGPYADRGIRPIDVGRVADFGPNIYSNEANTFGQALATIGLARAGVLTTPVVDKLLWQQCTEGFFAIFYGYSVALDRPATCDEVDASPDRDATAMGLSGLLAAQRSGVTGLQDDIDRAVAWLVSEQTVGGGWGGGTTTEDPNTNSTGLVVQALADAGGPAVAVADGEDYLRSAQATAAADSANALSDDIGAIAYSPEDYQTGKTDGITSLDTWIRAGAQASLGLSQVGFWQLSAGPDRTFAASGPSGFTLAGDQATVHATGLSAGESFTITAGAQLLASGRATRAGLVTAQVTVPAATAEGALPVVVTGAQAGRRGTATIPVLTSRSLKIKAAKRVLAGRKLTVTVTRLAPGEAVTVTLRKKTVHGVADARGRFTTKLKVRRPLGKAKVTAVGAFPSRSDHVKVTVARKR